MTATGVQPPAVRACCSTSCRDEVARTRFDEEGLATQERRLAALADPTRLRIVNLLARHEALCVCEIEAAFDLGQPTVSHHLRLLREAGLVNVERRGTWAYYSLARPAVKEVVGDLLALVWSGGRVMQRQPSINEVLIRAAGAPDLPQILDLLRRAGLIVAGVEERLGGFLVAADGVRVVGSAGLEVYGDVALLRSVVVDEGRRGEGLGRRLVTAALANARRLGVREVALLTTSAAPFFRRLRFGQVERQALDPRLAASPELGDECCATAVAMTLRLRPREDSLGATGSAEGPA